MDNTTGSYNAHLVDLRDPAEAALCGESGGSLPGDLSCCVLKLEAVEADIVPALGRLLAELGGEMTVCRPPARGQEGAAAAGPPDVLIAGSRRLLGRLAERLRNKPAPLGRISREVERCLVPGNRLITWGERTLDFRRQTYVMGILNCTPDSFFPGSRSPDAAQALERARRLIADGADILDVGGESTRPGSDEVTAAEESARILPVIRALRAESPVMISVDTRRREVAEAALEAGADLVNDVSGLRFDPSMAAMLAARQVPAVLMHMRGVPRTMQQHAHYQDVVGEVRRELQDTVEAALRAGVRADRIILDPGIGFSKTAEHNLHILRHLPSLASLGYPLLVGLSRKAFIGHLTGREVEERLAGTVAANALAVFQGADIIRVHDVREAVDAVRIARAVRPGDKEMDGGVADR